MADGKRPAEIQEETALPGGDVAGVVSDPARTDVGYKRLFDSIPVGIIEQDYSGVKRYLDELDVGPDQDLRAFFSSHHEALTECLSRARIVDVNQSLVDVLRAGSREHLIKVMGVQVTSGPPERLLETVLAVAEGRLERSREVTTVAFDGSPLTLAVSTSVVDGFEDTYERMLTSLTDITELRRTERQLAETAARFEAMTAASQVALVFYNPHGDLQYMNPAAEELMGMTFETARGKGWLESIAPHDRERVWTEFLEAIRDRRSYTTSGETIHPDGARVWWESNTAPVLIGDELVGYVDAIRDVTSHKLLVESLQQTQRELLASREHLVDSEARFRAMADASPVGIFFYNGRLEVTYVNKAAEELMGLRGTDALGLAWRDTIHPEDLDRLAAEVESAISAQQPFRGSARFVHADGRVIHWVADSAPVVIDGEAEGYVSALRDVTAEQQLLQELRERELQLSETQRIAGIGSVLFDLSDGSATWSRELYDVFGRPPRDPDPSFQEFLTWVHEEDRDALAEAWAREDAPDLSEFRVVMPSGDVRWMEATVVHADEDLASPLHRAVVQDVTGRRMVEFALRESRELLQSVLDSSPSAITIQDNEGRFLFLNDAAADLMGLSGPDMLGRRPSEILPTDAESLWLTDRRLIARGEPFQTQHELIVSGVLKHLDVLTFPIRDTSGSITGTGEVATDVTDRMKAEEARRSERRSIASDIHDDSVQVMASVALRLDALERLMTDPEYHAKLHELAAAVRDAVGRLRMLMFDLNSSVLEDEGLEAALRELLDDVERQHSMQPELRVCLSSEPPLAVRTALFGIAREAIMNVAKHAGASRVRVAVDREDDGVSLMVSDDGTGFQDHESTPGHLGLSSMRARAEGAGGRFEISSAPGAGSIVEAWVPLGVRRRS